MLMKNIFILLSILIIFTVCSCKNNNSLLSQITASTSDCSVNEEQAFYYYEKYGKNNPNITVDYGNTTGDDRINVIKKAFKVLSNVAEEYLETAFKTYNISVNIITKKTVEKYDGLTLLIYKDANSTMISHPKHIEYSTFEVLIHEFGHVSEILPQNKYSNFSYDLTDLANTISDTEKSLYLRHYNNSSQDPKDRETFAELFDTWYCSKAARNNLKLQIPDAYKFAKQYLLPPIGEVSEQQNTSDSDSLFVEIKQDTKTYQEIIDIVKNSKPNLNPSNCSSQKQGSIYVVKDNTTNLIWTDVIT